VFLRLTLLTITLSVTTVVAHTDDPFADSVVVYDQGIGATLGYTMPETTLGAPERFTGERFLPGAVTPFFPAFMPNEIVSIGAGGSQVLKFDTPVTDDPNNPYGIDLLIFGNSGFVDSSTAEGTVTGMLGPEGGLIEVSTDGVTWHAVDGIQADGLFPTMGYSDVSAYSEQPGFSPSVMTRPVDPRLTLNDFLNLSADEVCTLYRGSGGGAGIDLADVELQAISYIRISVPLEAVTVPEVDAVADVHPRRPGDVNDDGQVDLIDFSELLIGWGPSSPGGIPADFNLDGSIDLADFSIMLINWGS
jgi:hypothetical protein